MSSTSIAIQKSFLGTSYVEPYNTQLLKWVGNKQRFAHEIISYFPQDFERYIEPFLGSGAVLATLAPGKAIASDTFGPLMEIWSTLAENPQQLKDWYSERWHATRKNGKVKEYEKIKASYNNHPNGADLLFLSRSCYGGVVRFRKSDGHMSTPCGIHEPISPESFSRRVDEWQKRTLGTIFLHADYKDIIKQATAGDMIYCDPPYSDSQSILYGAQDFNLIELFEELMSAKIRGAFVALSIDGTKKSGRQLTKLPIPEGLFEREVFVNCGRSMLKRFQMQGLSLESEVVEDRLLLTF